jgi:LacI family transcriptional regulator
MTDAGGTLRRRSRAVTIKHVAAEAGVSVQTVSRVINKGPNVTPAVQARVNAAVEKLGYVPSLAARRLGGSRSFLILALNDLKPTVEGWQARRGNDWVDQMLLGGMLKSAEYGYRMLFELVESQSPELGQQVQSALSSLHPDGVILTPPHSENERLIDLLERSGVPFARIGSNSPGPGVPISMDDEEAARVATRHLAELGHRRIGFIRGHDDYRASADRLRGHRAALAESGIPVDEAIVRPGDFTYSSGMTATEHLLHLPDRPTAIIAGSDQMALAALHAAGHGGIDVPGQLSIVSFDDTPTIRLAVPPLTAVRQPIADMTAKAVELLIEGLVKPAASSNGHVLPFGFIVRGSTGPCPQG